MDPEFHYGAGGHTDDKALYVPGIAASIESFEMQAAVMQIYRGEGGGLGRAGVNVKADHRSCHARVWPA